MYKIDELIEFHKRNCNIYVNGLCYNRGCLTRGGWAPHHTEHNDLRTVPKCLYKETVLALERLKDLEGK